MVRGSIPAVRERSEVWQVPGVDGYGVALLGQGDTKFKLLAVSYSSLVGVELWAASLQALQGTIGTVANDLGESWSTCFFERVATPTIRAAYMPGSAITHRAEIEIDAVRL